MANSLYRELLWFCGREDDGGGLVMVVSDGALSTRARAAMMVGLVTGDDVAPPRSECAFAHDSDASS